MSYSKTEKSYCAQIYSSYKVLYIQTSMHLRYVRIQMLTFFLLWLLTLSAPARLLFPHPKCPSSASIFVEIMRHNGTGRSGFCCHSAVWGLCAAAAAASAALHPLAAYKVLLEPRNLRLLNSEITMHSHRQNCPKSGLEIKRKEILHMQSVNYV